MTTTIEEGRVKKLSKPMPRKIAPSLLLGWFANPRFDIAEGYVVPRPDGKARIEWYPGKAANLARERDKMIATRVQRAKRLSSYDWMRIANGVWRCINREGVRYVQDLRKHTCTCPDFGKAGQIGIPCKHLIYAEAAEQLHQGAVNG